MVGFREVESLARSHLRQKAKKSIGQTCQSIASIILPCPPRSNASSSSSWSARPFCSQHGWCGRKRWMWVVWDVWENGLLMKKWHDGNLHLSDLYAPRSQHRTVIPRLLIIALTTLSGGDFRWEQYFTFLLFVLDAWLLWRLLQVTLGESPWRWPLMFAINLLVFCPMHYQILFWGSSLWARSPFPACWGACSFMMNECWSPWLRLAGAALLAEIATHSFTHGILIWPVMLVFFLIQKSDVGIKTRIMMACAWIVLRESRSDSISTILEMPPTTPTI